MYVKSQGQTPMKLIRDLKHYVDLHSTQSHLIIYQDEKKDFPNKKVYRTK